jgi:hypothetical protein
MATELIIESITGKSPFNIYICQPDGNNCFFINTINETSYTFKIPYPYDTQPSYMLKIIDANQSIIIGNTIVE